MDDTEQMESGNDYMNGTSAEMWPSSIVLQPTHDTHRERLLNRQFRRLIISTSIQSEWYYEYRPIHPFIPPFNSNLTILSLKFSGLYCVPRSDPPNSLLTHASSAFTKPWRSIKCVIRYNLSDRTQINTSATQFEFESFIQYQDSPCSIFFSLFFRFLSCADNALFDVKVVKSKRQNEIDGSTMAIDLPAMRHC